jgi:phage shock protein A
LEAQDYKKLVEALRRCAEPGTIIDECDTYDDCPYSLDGYCGDCMNNLVKDAAAAIEALQAEVDALKETLKEAQAEVEQLKAELIDCVWNGDLD